MNDVNMVDPVNHWATSEDLEKSRPRITELYEDNTLPEVMKIMRSEHGVTATVNMYKKRINKWGLDKKNKEVEMKAVIRKGEKRTSRGKTSVFRARGRQVEYKDVVRYWKRRHLSVQDVLALCNSRETTPDALECFTPPPAQISLSVELGISERILKSISDYYCSSFESGTWFSTDPTDNCSSIKDPGYTASGNLAHLIGQFLTAVDLFRQGKFNEAGQSLICGTAVVKETLFAEGAETLPIVFKLTLLLHEERHSEIAMSIMRQFIALGGIILGQQHPVPQIIAWLATLDRCEYSHSIERAWRRIGDQFEHQLGRFHMSTIWNRIQSHHCRGLNDNAFHGILRECEIFFGAQDVRCFYLRLYLAEDYRIKGRCAEAEKEALNLLQDLQEMAEDRWTLLTSADTLNILSLTKFDSGNDDDGERYGRKAIAQMMSCSGERDPLARRWMLQLENKLLNAGRQESAMQVEQWRLTILERGVEEIQEVEGEVLGS